MAAYVKITNFAVKDGLLSGNPSKIVSGSEIDAELNAIALSSSQNLTAITDAQTATAASASAAATSATNAATSATNASTSATTATTQASNASTSATNAANSATSASTSATTATTQASNASTSATNAASSASAAATSETNAATSASTASTQASNASTSATNAANSATTATTQATNAATSATNAATSATTADTVVQSVAIKWTFSTTTTMADPGSGIIRFNNATPASVTAIAVDDNNSSAQDISAYVIAWDDSTSTNKGTLTIKQGTSLAIYTITTLTDNVGWTELAVTYVSGSGTFSDATATYVTFLRTGDKGATGSGDASTANPLSQFAATTSLQLAGVISDETGSGALVFATSPTLVTPALGTPSSGTLTSCTGLPVAGIAASTTEAIGVGSIELGHASDTTITRTGAGAIAVEGVAVVLSGGALGTPSSGTLTSCTGLPQAGTVGLTTADSPQFAALNIGHASDTTLTRVSAGKLAQEGVTLADVGVNNFTAAQNFARATVASHATTADIWAAAGNQIDWTGTATTTAFPNAPQAGAERVLICAGACSFTAGANMLIDGVASAATVTCAAGDSIIVRAVSTTQFKLSRVKYDGTAQVSAGGGAWVWLSTVTASASATVDIETTFDATYDNYVITVSGCSPTDDATFLNMRLKIGGTYNTSGYHQANYSFYSGGAAMQVQSSNTAIDLYCVGIRQLGNAAGESASGFIYISNPASSTLFKRIRTDFTGTTSNPMTTIEQSVGAYMGSTAALTGVRLYFEVGNIASGTFRLYGIKNS